MNENDTNNAGRTSDKSAPIHLLFTNYSDFGGRLVRFINHGGFSHVSISLEDKPLIFYSFNTKGFAVEKPFTYNPRTRMSGSLMVTIEVPSTVKEALRDEIDGYLRSRAAWTYTYLGVALCAIGIPFRQRRKRFCSQFVAEVLAHAGAVRLDRPAELCLPSHVLKCISSAFPKRKMAYDLF